MESALAGKPEPPTAEVALVRSVPAEQLTNNVVGLAKVAAGARRAHGPHDDRTTQHHPT